MKLGKNLLSPIASPRLRSSQNACDSPHLIILGAGASKAACPSGDANGRVLPLMADLAAVTGVESILQDAKLSHLSSNFEVAYQTVAFDPKNATFAREIEAKLRDYFEDVLIPDKVTLYDELLLSLREKDAIATFNWDPLLSQAFRRNRHLVKLPRILFLHGNVDIGVCVEHSQKGFREDRCGMCHRPLKPLPLLYPVVKKNYSSDPFIANEWKELQGILGKAYLLTIVGYAAPESDLEAKSLMLKVWKKNPTRELAEVSIVDVKSRKELEKNWKPFFVRERYGVYPSIREEGLLHHPRRSCDHLAMANLQQEPCHCMPLVDTADLRELQESVRPLIEQERALADYGTPLPC